MTEYSVWIVLETNEPDKPDFELRWWAVDHFHDRQEAESMIADICDSIERQTGRLPEELDE